MKKQIKKHKDIGLGWKGSDGIDEEKRIGTEGHSLEKGEACATTKSAVAQGTIDIRENPAQDISALSRDTTNSLNELERIFDKQKIEVLGRRLRGALVWMGLYLKTMDLILC